jgi:hypothetical protein
MRIICSFIVLLCLLVSAHAQTIGSPPGGVTGTITSGTTPITGGADKQVCFNDGGTLSCGNAGLIFTKSTGLLAPTLFNATGVGSAVAPSLAVGNATTGLYSVSTTGLGVAVNGVNKLDYGITVAGTWAIATSVIQATNTGYYTAGTVLQFGAGNTTQAFGMGSYGGTNNFGFIARSDGFYGWSSTTGTNVAFGTLDTIIWRPGAATLQFGFADAAAPVAQITQVQSVVAGNANNAGAAWTFQGSLSNGSGVGGDILFKTSLNNAASGSQNTAAAALTLKAGTQNVVVGALVVTKNYTVATLPAGVTGAIAYVTDAVACTFLAAPTGGGSVVCPVFYDGVSWKGG